jgi:hypothetical protein
MSSFFNRKLKETTFAKEGGTWQIGVFFTFSSNAICSVIIRGPKIFPLSGKFFHKTEKAEKLLEIFIFSMIKIFFFYEQK